MTKPTRRRRWSPRPTSRRRGAFRARLSRIPLRLVAEPLVAVAARAALSRLIARISSIAAVMVSPAPPWRPPCGGRGRGSRRSRSWRIAAEGGVRLCGLPLLVERLGPHRVAPRVGLHLLGDAAAVAPRLLGLPQPCGRRGARWRARRSPRRRRGGARPGRVGDHAAKRKAEAMMKRHIRPRPAPGSAAGIGRRRVGRVEKAEERSGPA